MQDPTLPIVKSLLLLDSEGKRIAVKYYSQDWYAFFSARIVFSSIDIVPRRRPTVPSQSNFEKSLWNKTNRMNARQEGAKRPSKILHAGHACKTICSLSLAAEIIMFENYIVVYKYLGDLMFYVTGSQDENELILYSVLQAFFESVSILLRFARGQG